MSRPRGQTTEPQRNAAKGEADVKECVLDTMMGKGQFKAIRGLKLVITILTIAIKLDQHSTAAFFHHQPAY
jgi:hypothetical protein